MCCCCVLSSDFPLVSYEKQRFPALFPMLLGFSLVSLRLLIFIGTLISLKCSAECITSLYNSFFSPLSSHDSSSSSQIAFPLLSWLPRGIYLSLNSVNERKPMIAVNLTLVYSTSHNTAHFYKRDLENLLFFIHLYTSCFSLSIQLLMGICAGYMSIVNSTAVMSVGTSVLPWVRRLSYSQGRLRSVFAVCWHTGGFLTSDSLVFSSVEQK